MTMDERQGNANLHQAEDNAHQTTKPSLAIQGASRAFYKSSRTFHPDQNGLNGRFRSSVPPTSLIAKPSLPQPQAQDVLHVPDPRGKPLSSRNLSFRTFGGHRDENDKTDFLLRQPSPSQIAAHLATSRATPSPLNEGFDSVNQSRELALNMSEATMQDNESSLDHTSVPATKSLVKLYESKQGSKAEPPVIESVRYVKKTTSNVASPRPPRPPPRSNSSASVISALPKTPAQSNPGSPTKPMPATNFGAIAAAAKSANVNRKIGSASPRKAPLPPPPRRSQRTFDGVQEGEGTTDDNAVSTSLHPVKHTSAKGPIARKQPSPLLRPKPIQVPPSDSPIERKESQRPGPPPRTTSQVSSQSKPSPSPPRTFHDMNITSQGYPPRLSIDSLANAMVASSLASSRASSPSKSIPPPPPRQRASKSHLFHLGSNHNHSSGDLVARTPSPVKTLRQTMREPLRSDSDTVEHRKKAHLARHPNKHHEGNRKRYRMQLTELERKRYEGVWAANRGLLLPPLNPAGGSERGNVNGEVVNIVVRDIWRRSRLPDDVLEEIWDMVNLQGRDRLGRDEFVVGMWLIDQRLKGKKLPIKVPESVWSSVKKLTGIKISKG